MIGMNITIPYFNLEYNVETSTTESVQVDSEGGPNGILVVVDCFGAMYKGPVARDASEHLVFPRFSPFSPRNSMVGLVATTMPRGENCQKWV